MKKKYVLFTFCILAKFISAQTVSINTQTLGSGYTGGNGGAGISFVVENTNPFPVLLKSVSNYFASPNPITPELYYSSTELSGPISGPINANPAWTLAVAGPSVTSANNAQTMLLSALSFPIPALTTYRFYLNSATGNLIAYTSSGPTVTPNSFSNSGVNLLVGDYPLNGLYVGYGGLSIPSRSFTGTIGLSLCTGIPTDTTITVWVCDSYTLNGITYDSTGAYYQTLSNVAGCDSTITLIVNISPVNTNVTPLGTTLAANTTGASYQWLMCPSYSLITGATSQFYTATNNGSYAVAITQNSCTDTSACYTVAGVATNDILLDNAITLSPNPSENWVTIFSKINPMNNYSLKIFNIAGQKIYTNTTIYGKELKLNMSTFSNGIYFIELFNKEGLIKNHFKVVKK